PRVPLELSPKARHTWRGRCQSPPPPPKLHRHCRTTLALREVRSSSSGAARPFPARAQRVPWISSRACLTTQSSRRRVETSRFLPARGCNSSFANSDKIGESAADHSRLISFLELHDNPGSVRR